MSVATAEQAKPYPRSNTSILARIRKRWYCYLMMAGTLGLLVTFSYYPAFSALYHSFTVWNAYHPAEWVGLRNYQEIFTQGVFLSAFKNMALLGTWQVIRSATFPLIGAALLYRIRDENWSQFFRLLYVLPIVVPGVVGVMVWRQLFEPNIGLFNTVLKALGLQPLGWLSDPKIALMCLMLVGFPWIDGVGLLIYLAGFLAIPQEVIEASIVDGAGSWRRFWTIELPLIVPQIRLIVILNVIGAFQNFGWQLLVTKGGPLDSTMVPAYLMYREAIMLGRYGTSSAIGVVLFSLILTLTLINLTLIRSNVEYAAG